MTSSGCPSALAVGGSAADPPEEPTGLTRRGFLSAAARTCAGCALAALGGGLATTAVAEAATPQATREAMFYSRLAGGLVRCDLCPCDPLEANCGVLRDGEVCVCRVRFNRGGRLFTSTYGRPSILSPDPIEKNPIYHMMPGLRSLSVATAGCSMSCKCCQNWQLSQAGVEQVRWFAMGPREVVTRALGASCRAVTFTYTEPMVAYEYTLDTAKAARRRGLRTAVATSGYVLPEPLKMLAPHVDAFSVSVKAFTEEAYQQVLGGSFDTVKETLVTLAALRAWFEIVVLPIPTVSDDLGQMGGFFRWVRNRLGPVVPVHLLRFVPEYRLRQLQPTPVALLDEARALARRAGLQYVYVGNLPGHSGANTICPHCSRTLVVRVGMRVLRNDVRKGRCSGCGTRIPGVWG